jgi:putative glutamine amidotransferase
MRRRPFIGVTASVRGGRAMWWFNRLAIARAGGHAIRITANEAFPVERLSGVVVGGGDDIEATLYGALPQPAVRVDPQRDRLELRVLDCAARLRLPVLGICRGAQMINIHRGGSLHTDIHEVFVKAPRMRTVLPRKHVVVAEDSRLARILGASSCRVNALHHQSVDRAGDGLRKVACDEHGIVQAIEAFERGFVVGVQWHPEFLVGDSGQQNLFRSLVAAGRREEVAERATGASAAGAKA